MKELISAFGQQWLAALKKQPHIALAFTAVLACGIYGWMREAEAMDLYRAEVKDRQKSDEAKEAQIMKLADDKIRAMEEQHKTDAQLKEYLENKIRDEQHANYRDSRKP